MFSRGDAAIEYGNLKTFLLQHFTPSAASRVTQLLQLAKQPLGDQRPSDAMLEMKALARFLPAADGSVKQLDLLRALWLLRLPENIRVAIPNAEEMNETDLQQMADRLKDSHAAASYKVNAAPLQDEDNIAVVNLTPSHTKLPKRQQQRSEKFINSL